MKPAIFLILAIVVAAPFVFAQDAPKKLIEGPVEKALAPTPDRGSYDLAKTGIKWHKGIDAVVDKGKPIILFQLLGNFDELFC